MADFIPSSVRADGSVRKERRVRPGYVPQDEIPAYVPPARRNQGNSAARLGGGGRGEGHSGAPQESRTLNREKPPRPVTSIAGPSPATSDADLDALRLELAEIIRLQEDLQRRRADVETRIAILEKDIRSSKTESRQAVSRDKLDEPQMPKPLGVHNNSHTTKADLRKSSENAEIDKLASHLGDLDIVPPDDS